MNTLKNTNTFVQDIYAELTSRYPWSESRNDQESIDFWANSENWEVSKHNFIFDFTIEDIDASFEVNSEDVLYFRNVYDSANDITYIADYGPTMDAETNYSLTVIDCASFIPKPSTRQGTGKRAPRVTGLTFDLWLKCFVYSRSNIGTFGPDTKKVLRLSKRGPAYILELCLVQFDRTDISAWQSV